MARFRQLYLSISSLEIQDGSNVAVLFVTALAARIFVATFPRYLQTVSISAIQTKKPPRAKLAAISVFENLGNIRNPCGGATAFGLGDTADRRPAAPSRAGSGNERMSVNGHVRPSLCKTGAPRRGAGRVTTGPDEAWQASAFEPRVTRLADSGLATPLS